MTRSTHYSQPAAPQWALVVLNQVFELERKVASEGTDARNLQRHIAKIKDAFEEQGLFYHDPTGEAFSETRTDLDASVSGPANGTLHVVEVLKPIVREGTRALSRVVQKGIVVVESKQKTTNPPTAI